MATSEERLARALESEVENLEFVLDAASIDFDVMTSPNTNQCIIVFAEGERLAYVTAELSWGDIPAVFVDIYSMDADGAERRVRGGLSADAAITYITNA